ncbi:MAG: kelch repeat-containing protein, partial [Candidatus Thermoplasmatota archaeon]|nr:kelch repeat-containing protein [Candidatus Thermoplasmatota archaeon]
MSRVPFFFFLLLLIPLLSGSGDEHSEYGVTDIVGSISSPRFNHTANLLNDDRVLIAGGTDDGQRSLSSCEIYDSTERKWELTSPMNVDRQRHTSDLLSDG